MTMTVEAIANDEAAEIHNVPVKEIYLDPDFNCRGAFGPMDCTELAMDIAKRGLQQPIVIRPLREVDHESGKAETLLLMQGYKYVTIAGHRRLTAYKINKGEMIPSILKDMYIAEFDALDLNATENLMRKELNMQQECQAVRHYWIACWNREDTAKRIGKSPGWVQVRFMLLDMPVEIQELAGQGYINTTDVRELSKYKNPARQLELAGILRDKRKRGVKNAIRFIIKKDSPDTKKHRKREQIFDMMEEVRVALKEYSPEKRISVGDIVTAQGNSFSTRLASWCAGEITTIEFYVALREFCSICGVHYEIPTFEEGLL